MKKSSLKLLTLGCLVAFLAACNVTWNVDKMIEDYVKYKEEGNTEYAQKLYDKLVELDQKGVLTDEQYYRFEDALSN